MGYEDALKYVLKRGEALLETVDDEAVAIGICLVLGIVKARCVEIGTEDDGRKASELWDECEE